MSISFRERLTVAHEIMGIQYRDLHVYSNGEANGEKMQNVMVAEIVQGLHGSC